MITHIENIGSAEVSRRLHIPETSHADNYSLHHIFGALQTQFKTPDKTIVETRKEVVDFIVSHLKHRHAIFHHYRPLDFPLQEKGRHDAMVVALICDMALTQSSSTSLSQKFGNAGVDLARAIYRQSQELQNGLMEPAAALPESRFLAQVDAVDALRYIKLRFARTHSEQLADLVGGPLRIMAEITDPDLAIGRRLKSDLAEILEKIDQRMSKEDTFVVPTPANDQ